MGTRRPIHVASMLNQRRTSTSTICVEKMLDLQIETTLKRRRCIDVAILTHFKRRSYVVFALNVRALVSLARGNPVVPLRLVGFWGAPTFRGQRWFKRTL